MPDLTGQLGDVSPVRAEVHEASSPLMRER